MACRTTAKSMTQLISVHAKRSVAAGYAVLSGLLTWAIVGGVAVGRTTVVALILLVGTVPMFVFSLPRAIRRVPELVFEPTGLVYVRKHKAVRWDSVVEAYVNEWRGLYRITHHELVIGGAVESTADGAGGVATEADGMRRIVVGSIDQLSLPWSEIATLVEERLPSSVELKRESGRTRRRQGT
jgi:hypothetical protein